MCRLGLLLVWLLAAANIALFMQSTQNVDTDANALAQNAKPVELAELFTLDHLMASDVTIQLAGVSISAIHLNIAVSVLMAIFATALLAMAIALIDLRNGQIRRSRH